MTDTDDRYTLDGRYYEQNSELQTSFAQQTLELYTIREDERILDVACGDGRLTAAMSEYASRGETLGLDSSPEMIESASARAGERLRFVCSRHQDYEPSQPHTLVTCFNAMHWFEDQAGFIRACHDWLAPGGHFLCLTYPGESAYMPLFLDALGDRWSSHVSAEGIPSLSTYIELCQRAGFRVVTLRAGAKELIYETRDELEHYVRGWLPSLAPIPREAADEYLDEVWRLAEQRGFVDDERICIPYFRMKLLCMRPS